MLFTFLIKYTVELGMPGLKLYAGVSSFETISPTFKSGQS